MEVMRALGTALLACSLLGCGSDDFELASGAVDAAVDSKTEDTSPVLDSAALDSTAPIDSGGGGTSDAGAPDVLVLDAAVPKDGALVGCELVTCLGTQKCCPLTLTCYDPKCLGCCMSG
jgi:hypothetical protein